MVASDLDLLKNIGEYLVNRSYRVTIKEVNQTTIYGNIVETILLHGVSPSEDTIIYIRKHRDSNTFRIKINIRKSLDDEVLDQFEEEGFKVHDEDDQVVIIGNFKPENILDKIAYILEIVD